MIQCTRSGEGYMYERLGYLGPRSSPDDSDLKDKENSHTRVCDTDLE